MTEAEISQALRRRDYVAAAYARRCNTRNPPSKNCTPAAVAALEAFLRALLTSTSSSTPASSGCNHSGD